MCHCVTWQSLEAKSLLVIKIIICTLEKVVYEIACFCFIAALESPRPAAALARVYLLLHVQIWRPFASAKTQHISYAHQVDGLKF